MCQYLSKEQATKASVHGKHTPPTHLYTVAISVIPVQLIGGNELSNRNKCDKGTPLHHSKKHMKDSNFLRFTYKT